MNVVLFELAGGYHALPGEMVREVIATLPATPLPFAPVWVDGLINHAGTVLLRLDLAVRLGLAERPMDEEGMLLIAHTGAVPSALHIQRVVAMVTLADTAVHWCAPSDRGAAAPGKHAMVLGEFDWNGHTVFLLDATRLAPDDLSDPFPEGRGGLLGPLEEDALASLEQEDDGLRYLVVESQGSRYALLLEEVREVVEVTSLTPFPHAPREVAGVVSLRQQPYLALTLAGLLDARKQEECPVMILVEHLGVSLGLLVKRVAGIAAFPRDHCHATENQAYYHNLLQDRAGHMIAQLNLAGLIDAPRMERFRPFLVAGQEGDGGNGRHEVIRSFLSVRIGGERCVLPLETVERVVEYAPPDPLTGVVGEDGGETGFMDGVVQIHGEITPVSDLRQRFGGGGEDSPHVGYVVVRVAERPWALVVDRIDRVVRIPEHAIEPLGQQPLAWIAAVGQLDGQLYSVLNVALLSGGAPARAGMQ